MNVFKLLKIFHLKMFKFFKNIICGMKRSLKQSTPAFLFDITRKHLYRHTQHDILKTERLKY